MVGYPRSCDDVKQDIQRRHERFINDGWIPKVIEEDAILHRLIRKEDIDVNTRKPRISTFSNHGLSVLIESKNYPLDIRKCVEENPTFIGAVKLNAKELKEMEYEIYPDPHPDPSGNQQHTNHAQVICKKTTGKTKKMRDNCQWSISPPDL